MADQLQQGSNVGPSRVTKCRSMSSKRVRSEASSPPCGACKHKKKKCTNDCFFKPYFSSNQGSEQFARVKDLFGSKNVKKMLNRVEVDHRHDVVASISYEAQARLDDPVHGCLSVIRALEQQVASLQGELTNAMVQNQLISNATLLQSIQQQHQPLQPNINIPMQSPYSNNSSLYTNCMNTSFINPSFDHFKMQTTPSTHISEPFQFSELPQHEEESMIPQVFNDDINLPVQPAYCNNSSLNTNFMNISSFNPSFDHLAMQTTPSGQSLEPLPLSRLPRHEEESMISPVFENDITHLIP